MFPQSGHILRYGRCLILKHIYWNKLDEQVSELSELHVAFIHH